MIDADERKALTAGMTLTATYKKEKHRVEVLEGEEGKLRYRLADGREFASPSAAGKALMGGIACNGWRFFSLAGAEATEVRTAKPAVKTRKPAAKKPKQPKAPELEAADETSAEATTAAETAEVGEREEDGE